MNEQVILRTLGFMLLLQALPVASRAAEVIDKQPRWELGAGVGVMTLADYPGSDQQHLYVLPLPYFVYRGDHIKADRGGVRGKIFDSDDLDVELSLSASAPVHSTDNSARHDMPNLDPTLEIGPQLQYRLSPASATHFQIDLRLPLRAVYAVNQSGLHEVGTLISPALNLDVRNVWGDNWHLGVNIGPVFSSKSFNAYYYNVSPGYATAERPAYAAPGGYGGTQFTTALSHRRGHLWVGGFTRLNALHGAVFHDSPLVRQSYAFSAGVAVAWIFAASSELVDASHEP